jgi:hypothetical protein
LVLCLEEDVDELPQASQSDLVVLRRLDAVEVAQDIRSSHALQISFPKAENKRCEGKRW